MLGTYTALAEFDVGDALGRKWLSAARICHFTRQMSRLLNDPTTQS